ncbi:DUF2218 domain-containing protein [Actinomyces sp. HMT897]|uniref:DUF2218 domain-containing protein n=1 Tax=Actinomyces sp. HMT897 TaxID=2789424 RepID=UPI001FF047AB|nr:DUF2218 domain-containing protein [Actinomyces sp. HMT897]
MTGPMTPPSPTAVSTAHVKTDRPARYGRQLTSHMGRKISAAWDEASSTGSLDMNRGGTSTGVCDLSCQPGTLVLRLSSDEEHLAHLEEVIGIHLARFGSKDALRVSWVRADGSAGTTQGPLTAEDLAARARRRETA